VTDAEADARAVDGEPSAPAKPRRLLLFGLVAVAALAIDIVSKAIVAASSTSTRPVRLLGGACNLVETRNSGAGVQRGHRRQRSC